MIRHIIVIGFKHVGKSTVGKLLASHFTLPYYDMDELIMKRYEQEAGKSSTPRDIMTQHGEPYFRALEARVFHTTLTALTTPSIITLGGGTPLLPENQTLLQGHQVVWVNASQEIVFQRIMQHGIPSFFPADQDPHKAFTKLWRERQPIYARLATLTIDSSGTPEDITRNISTLSL